MPRIANVALAYSTCMILLSSSAVPQVPARTGADAASGQLIFNNACRTCHTTKEGDNRLGPNLHDIIGRKAGSLPNFGYSSAMKGADFVWDISRGFAQGPRRQRAAAPWGAPWGNSVPACAAWLPRFVVHVLRNRY
jgi:cytochrome c2